MRYALVYNIIYTIRKYHEGNRNILVSYLDKPFFSPPIEMIITINVNFYFSFSSILSCVDCLSINPHLLIRFTLNISSISKEAVENFLEKSDYSLYRKSDSASVEWSVNFDRIRNEERKDVGFVRCHRCFSLFVYDKKNGTSSVSSVHAFVFLRN